jgi:hypothetical protein
MDWIILKSDIPNLLEEIDTFDDLAKQVHEYNCLSTLSGISPSFINTLSPRRFSKREKV